MRVLLSQWIGWGLLAAMVVSSLFAIDSERAPTAVESAAVYGSMLLTAAWLGLVTWDHFRRR